MADENDEKFEAKKDDEDLDALLDSALEDFDKPKTNGSSTAKSTSSDFPSSDSTSDGRKEAESVSTTENDPKLECFGLSESDIEAAAEEFEKSMKAMLGEDEELLKQWNEFTEKAASFKPDVAEANPEDVEDFEAHLLKTMKNIAENAKEFTDPSAEFDENVIKAMADMNVDGAQELNGIFPMMHGMMMNLLSKDVLYPALDDLRSKYPSWLQEKKQLLESDVYENYLQQYKLVCEICSEYEKGSDHDTDETKKKRFERLMALMQKMQAYGHPPEELVGDKPSGLNVEGNTPDGFPPQQCPVM